MCIKNKHKVLSTDINVYISYKYSSLYVYLIYIYISWESKTKQQIVGKIHVKDSSSMWQRLVDLDFLVASIETNIQ